MLVKIIPNFYDDFQPELMKAWKSNYSMTNHPAYRIQNMSVHYSSDEVNYKHLLIEHHLNKRVDYKGSYYRYYTEKDTRMTPLIHGDGLIDAYACVIFYSSDYNNEGFRFWEKKSSGNIRQPFDEMESVSQAEADRINEEGNNLELWEPWMEITFTPNMAIIFPSDLYHSKWPKENRGKGLFDGRLIEVIFFSLKT